MASGSHTTHDPTAAFPLDHGFLRPGRTNFRVDKMIVRQDDYVRFLSVADNLKFCELRAPRSKLHVSLEELERYVTIAARTEGHGARRYKFGEGFWNLKLTEHGKRLPDSKLLLTVWRQCPCGAIKLTETVFVGNLRNNKLVLQFSSFMSTHTVACVPPGTTERPKLLISERVAVKEVGRNPTARPRDIEQGNITLSSFAHATESASILMESLAGVKIEKIRQTLKNSRAVGREDGDFVAVHRMITALARGAEAEDTLDAFNIIEYHPARDESMSDPKNPNSWWWILIEMPCVPELSLHIVPPLVIVFAVGCK